MSDLFIDKNYSSKDYTTISLQKGEYDSCTFKECNFEGLHLSNCTFLDCAFYDCNFTNTTFGGTSFQSVDFIQSKLLGANFSVCNPFMLQLRFRESVLRLTNFISLDLQNIIFSKCNLEEADFTEANLSGADFSESNLQNAIFNDTILEKANLETALHFTIDPTQNRLKGTRFLENNLSGLVSHLGIKIN